jgi:hypothetical protein
MSRSNHVREEPMLVYHVPQDLTVGDLLHGAVLASVDVEPVQTTSVYKALVRFP